MVNPASNLGFFIPGEAKAIKQPDLSPAGVTIEGDSGLCVYPVEKDQKSYYAVTTVVEGNENREVRAGANATTAAIAEKPGIPEPYKFGGYFRYTGYVMYLGRFNPWDPRDAYGFDNRLSAPMFFSVAMPDKFDAERKKFYSLSFHLHPFGHSYYGSTEGVDDTLSYKDPATGETLWGGFTMGFNDCCRLVFRDKEGALQDIGPYLETSAYGYSGYAGWNSHYIPAALTKQGLRKTFAPSLPFGEGKSVMYAQKSMKAIANWMFDSSPWAATLDRTRFYSEGGSMGAIGSFRLAVHNSELVAAVSTTVGTPAPWTLSCQFGPKQESIPTPEGVGIYDYLDLGPWLSRHPGLPYPPFRLVNGKRDTTVGRTSIPPFVEAAGKAGLGILLYFSQGTHTVADPEARWPEMISDRLYPREQNKPGFNLFHYRTDRAYLVFTDGSLDDNPGKGDPDDGAPRGGINRWPYWDWRKVVDEPDRFETDIFLLAECPKDEGAVSITLQRLQKLAHPAGARYKWKTVDRSAKVTLKEGDCGSRQGRPSDDPKGPDRQEAHDADCGEAVTANSGLVSRMASDRLFGRMLLTVGRMNRQLRSVVAEQPAQQHAPAESEC